MISLYITFSTNTFVSKVVHLFSSDFFTKEIQNSGTTAQICIRKELPANIYCLELNTQATCHFHLDSTGTENLCLE